MVATASSDNLCSCLQCSALSSGPLLSHYQALAHLLGANPHQSVVLGSSDCSEAKNGSRRLSRVKDKMRADAAHRAATVPLAHACAAKHVVVCCLKRACA